MANECDKNSRNSYSIHVLYIRDVRLTNQPDATMYLSQYSTVRGGRYALCLYGNT